MGGKLFKGNPYFCENPKNFLSQCHGMSWNVMECHGMSWNVMECHGMSWIYASEHSHITGWWFGTCGLSFHNIWDVILPLDELHHFSRWLSHHQPDNYSHMVFRKSSRDTPLLSPRVRFFRCEIRSQRSVPLRDDGIPTARFFRTAMGMVKNIWLIVMVNSGLYQIAMISPLDA